MHFNSVLRIPQQINFWSIQLFTTSFELFRASSYCHGRQSSNKQDADKAVHGGAISKSTTCGLHLHLTISMNYIKKKAWRETKNVFLITTTTFNITATCESLLLTGTISKAEIRISVYDVTCTHKQEGQKRKQCESVRVEWHTHTITQTHRLYLFFWVHIPTQMPRLNSDTNITPLQCKKIYVKHTSWPKYFQLKIMRLSQDFKLSCYTFDWVYMLTKKIINK